MPSHFKHRLPQLASRVRSQVHRANELLGTVVGWSSGAIRGRLPDDPITIVAIRMEPPCECIRRYGAPFCAAHSGAHARSGFHDSQSETLETVHCYFREALNWRHSDLTPAASAVEADHLLWSQITRDAWENAGSISQLPFVVYVEVPEEFPWEWRPANVAVHQDVKPSAEEILRRLGPGTSDREQVRQMVIDAEVVRFTEREFHALLPVLRQFIECFRTSDDPADMVAVGSALRKYVMNMPKEDLDKFHVLFDPSALAPVPFEIEMELVKTLLWKLTLAPPDVDEPLPELSDRLMDRAEGYLRPWMLLRENHAAVAQDACLGLLLLRSRHVPRLLDLLRNLRVDWFVNLLLRRARWLKDDIESRFSPKDASRYAQCIIALEESIEQKPV